MSAWKRCRGPRARALLPGPVTVLIPNPDHHFPLACGPTPDVLGVRLPAGSPLAAVGSVIIDLLPAGMVNFGKDYLGTAKDRELWEAFRADWLGFPDEAAYQAALAARPTQEDAS